MVHTMLDNLAKMYKITYRILEEEEKDYFYNSPSFHVYNIENQRFLIDLSTSYIDKNQLDMLIDYIKYIIKDMLNIYNNEPKNNTDIDILTKTYNRAYFEKKLYEISNPVIISGDVNNLKAMNDVFGHAAGDNLLITASGFLLKHAKNDYIIARCGGDEFNIIIPNGTLNEAKNFCCSVQQECNNYSGELLLKPQIALGYAKKDNDESIEDTLKRADNFMYENKLMLKSKNDIITELEHKMYEFCYANKKEMQDKLRLAISFGLYLDLSLSVLSDLALAIKMEEIGMLVVPKEVRFKNEPLSPEEVAVIKKHPEVGFRLAKLDNSTLRIATTIYQCHECFDGSGYPNGTKGEQIDYLARIISIVTGYSDIYRKNKRFGHKNDTHLKTITLLKDSNKYDPILLRQFIDYLDESEELTQKGEYI